MRQTCEQCRWYFKKDGLPPACYADGKWSKWIKAKSVDKPNACDNFEVVK
jgi:hypothetical protein